MRLPNRRVPLAGAAAVLMLGSPAHAQSAAPPAAEDRNSGLEEIIVTARKREETAQVTPVSVTAVSGARLEKLQVTRMDELTEIAPNVSIVQAGNSIGTVITTMRGIGITDPILTNDSPVALYVDDVYIGRTVGALLDLIDIDRVEILRGPQGTLFGRNTTGGALSLFSQAPAAEFGIRQKFGYASDNEFTTTTTVDTGEIGSSGILAKLEYNHHQSDGFVRNTLTASDDGFGATRSDAVRLALHADLTDRLTVDYKFDYDTQRDRPLLSQTVAASASTLAYFGKSPQLGGSPFVVSLDPLDTTTTTDYGPSTLEVLGHNLTLRYDLSDTLKLKSITAYRSMKEVFSTVTGGNGPLEGLIVNPLTGAVSIQPVTLYDAVHDNQNQYQWSQELQLSGTVDRLNYVVGLYYFDENVGESDPQHFTLALPPGFVGLNLTAATNYSGESQSLAAYSQASYTPPILDDKLELTAGLRFTKDEKWMEQFDTSEVRNLHKNFYDLSESFSAKYQMDRDLMAYFRFAKAYKAGGFSPRDAGPGYGPEKATAYEGGIKTDLLDRHVRLNADIFYTDYTQMQINQLVATPTGSAVVVVNAGEATFTGGELELTVLPATGWEIDLVGGYTAPEYESYLTSRGNTNVDIANTGKFKYFSKLTSTVRAQYEFAPMPVGDLSIAASWSYTGPKYFTTDVDPSVSPFAGIIRAPAFNDVGARITLANIPTGFGALTAQFYGKNLLDERQNLAGIDFGPTLGFATVTYGRGRVLGIDLSARF